MKTTLKPNEPVSFVHGDMLKKGDVFCLVNRDTESPIEFSIYAPREIGIFECVEERSKETGYFKCIWLTDSPGYICYMMFHDESVTNIIHILTPEEQLED